MSKLKLRLTLFAFVLASASAQAEPPALRSSIKVQALFSGTGGLYPSLIPRSAPQDQKGIAETGRILRERHEILMLAAMGYTYLNRSSSPVTGYDITALIAWDVSNLNRTPKFVIDRNRNREYKNGISHAETNTIRRAWEAYNREKGNDKLSESLAGWELEKTYNDALANATLYTTLEPCPMCGSTILLARIPRVEFCMEDPGLRHPDRGIKITTPTEAFGRKVTQNRSKLELCEGANETMWKNSTEAAQQKKRFSITEYASQEMDRIFKPAFEKLASYCALYEENRELVIKIQETLFLKP